MRLMDLQSKWLKAHITVQGIKEAIGTEQFLNSLSMEKRAWVSDKKPTTCVQAGELADEYELARNQNQEPQDKVDNPPRKQSLGTPKKWCSYCRVPDANCPSESFLLCQSPVPDLQR